MKKLLQIIALAFIAIHANAQAPNQGMYTGVYKWTDAVLMVGCDENGKSVSNSNAVYSITDSKFTVYNVLKDSIVIKMYDYTVYNRTTTKESSENNIRLDKGDKLFKVRDMFFKYNFSGKPSDYDSLSSISANNRNYDKKQIYFRIALITFNQKSQKITKISGALALGAINFPFKYRVAPGRADFSGAFNIGAAIGYKFKHDSLAKWTYTIPLAISVSSINIDSSSATRNQGLLKLTNNFSALSLAGGIIFENNKVQLGLFFGFDKISRLNNVEYNWAYQDKPWFSIGFGYSLFTADKPAKSGTTDSQQ